MYFPLLIVFILLFRLPPADILFPGKILSTFHPVCFRSFLAYILQTDTLFFFLRSGELYVNKPSPLNHIFKSLKKFKGLFEQKSGSTRQK